jgi:NAD(P)-dependent dehydrogenase (short-subunit alcohol dehydrogenase family)
VTVSDPTVLITGAGSGIGLATVLEFARNGWSVIAGVRSMQRSEALRQHLEAAGLGAIIRELNVASDDSMHLGLDEVLREHGEIDVVISNAGIGIDGTTEELSLDDFRASFETNVLGSVRILHALMPRWRHCGSGRFIAVGSTAGAVGSPFNDAYCASKFALEGLIESLHPVAALQGIYVSIVEPGPVAGDFAVKHGPPSSRSANSPYADARQRFQTVQDSGYAAAQSPQEVAAVLFMVATTEAPKLRYQTSESVQRLVGVKLADLNGDRVARLLARWI